MNLAVGTIAFSIVVTLLATSAGLLVTFFLALPVAWLFFVCTRGFGIVERSRLAALIDVDLPDPHAPLPPGSWWAHLKASDGHVQLTLAAAPTQVHATSSAGGVTIVVPDTPDAYRVDASSADGGTDVRVRTDPASSRVIDAHSSGGRVTVRYP